MAAMTSTPGLIVRPLLARLEVTAARMCYCPPKNLVTTEQNSTCPSKSYTSSIFLQMHANKMPSFRRKWKPTQCMTVASETPDSLNILVIGAGGREHALCHALSKSPSCKLLYCAPGNVGISLSGDAECVSLDISNSLAVIQFCHVHDIGLVVVGPEAPLVAGLVDDLTHESIPAFGPTAEAAQLEGSKSFMKNICDTYGIPTAAYATFTDPEKAKAYIQSQGVPIVVKADGLAAGKGVVVAQTKEEAMAAIDSMLVDKAFGSAGGSVVIEEFLEGEEVSFFALVDGKTAVPLGSAQDHKAVGEGDQGPNTGGMGAYSPAPVLTPSLQETVLRDIVEPTVRGMSLEGCPFTGVLYAGLMVKEGAVKLLEYNVRFGDPECQVLMMRLRGDLALALLAAAQGTLSDSDAPLEWSPESALVVVMATKGYPGTYSKGSVIRGLEGVLDPGVKVFHAGTARNDQGDIVAVGGRVLGVTAVGDSVLEAQQKAYRAVDVIDWPQGFCRRDIGWRAVQREQNAQE